MADPINKKDEMVNTPLEGNKANFAGSPATGARDNPTFENGVKKGAPSPGFGDDAQMGSMEKYVKGDPPPVKPKYSYPKDGNWVSKGSDASTYPKVGNDVSKGSDPGKYKKG